MRTFFAILVGAMFAIKLFAADTNAPDSPKADRLTPKKIGALEATNYYDQVMIVTGTVSQVTIRPKVTFLNLDQPYPDSPFTIVIFHGHSSFYGNADALRGKSIEVRGKIRNYHDKPEIALDNTNQLTVIGVTNLELLLKPKIAPMPTNAPPSVQSTNLPEIM
jgi:DNA/RNA endonuclease YhcR with UshA esterase domain